MKRKKQTLEQIGERARRLTMVDADNYLARLDLSRLEVAWLVPIAHDLFNRVREEYDIGSDIHGVDLRPVAASSAAALVTVMLDSLDRHTARLLSEEE